LPYEVRLFAYGQLNLSMRDFELLSLREWSWLSRGYEERQKEQWRHTREILAFIHNSTMGVKKKLKGKELYPFADELIQDNEKEWENLVNMIRK
jgi:DNA-binding ferritin-like protein (Dps family)